MCEVAPTRKWTLAHDFKSSQVERLAPTVFVLERAWTSDAAPLSIVYPAHDTVPPECRHVFVNDREPAFAQDSAYFIQHQPRIVRVMQHVTKQHGVEALVTHRKVAAVVGQVIDARRRVVADVESDHWPSK